MENLVGKKYGRLTVTEFDHKEKRVSSTGKSCSYFYYWKCKCECGNEIVICSNNLKRTKNPTVSCGCFNKESHATSDGDSGTRFYGIFNKIKQRCTNPNDKKYNDYGGRGITCSWNSYKEFKADMYESYIEHVNQFGEKDTTIDRIDVHGNYCKNNCRWATYKQQNRNRRNTIYVEMEDGSLMPLAEIAEKLGINRITLKSRYRASKYNGTHRIPYKELIRDKDIV